MSDELNYTVGDTVPTLGTTIEDVVVSTENVLVFVDTQERLQTLVRSDHDIPEGCYGLLCRVRRLVTASQILFIARESRRQVSNSLGYAVGACLEGETDAAEKGIADVRERLEGVAAMLHALGATAAFLLTLLAAGVAMWTRDLLPNVLGEMGWDLLQCALVGGVGAWFSVVIGVGKRNALHEKISAILGWGAIRVAAGWVAGLVAGLALKADLLGALIDEASRPAVLLVALFAGSSERFVPELGSRLLRTDESDQG